MNELDKLFAEVEPLIVKKSYLEEGTKLCNGCGVVKPVTEFNNRKDRGSSDKYGKVSKCRDCTTAQAKEWYYRDHDKTKALARATQYRIRHGERITPEEANQLAESNVGYCDICSDYGVIHLDHNHTTEERRGFLCSRCNLALGGFKDNVEFLQRAVAYLLRYTRYSE